jgi:hypothetical protein
MQAKHHQGLVMGKRQQQVPGRGLVLQLEGDLVLLLVAAQG